MLAAGVPVGAAAWVRAETDALSERVAQASGVAARIGGVDADLTGAVRLTDVALGDLFAADALEASVAMGSLLGGQLRADELRVDAPRVAIQLEANGDSDLARLARKLASRRGQGPASADSGAGSTGLRRVIVAQGTLTASIAGIGELTADGVELVPDAGGVRVITGPVRLRGVSAPVAADFAFSRAAADVSLPQLRFGRAIAVGGTGMIAAGVGPGAGVIALRDVAAGRLAAHGPLELRATVLDGPAARPLAIDLARAPEGGFALAVRGDRIPLGPLAALAPKGLGIAGARVSGSVVVRRGAAAASSAAGPETSATAEPAAGGVALSADVAIEQLVVDHAAIAPRPIALTGRVRGDVSVARDAIAWTRGAVELGAIQLATSGWVRRPAPLSGHLELSLAAAPCADLLASLPPDLRGPLDGMVLEGSLGARTRAVLDLAAPTGEGAILSSSFDGGCRVRAEPPAADVSALASAGDQMLLDGSHRRVGAGEPDYVELRSLPAYVPGAFVSAEDGRFYDHAGFDLQQIARSLEIDLRERRLARGGSTISQQLVKNAFLSQRRSLDRKLHEAVLTWRLESRLDKRQILERYLNIIELGPRRFGLTAAAQHWFGLSPRDLTIRQAAFLAALTAQPTSMSRRVRRAGSLDADSAERVSVVLRAMRRDGVISSAAYDEAKGSPLKFTSSALRD